MFYDENKVVSTNASEYRAFRLGGGCFDVGCSCLLLGSVTFSGGGEGEGTSGTFSGSCSSTGGPEREYISKSSFCKQIDIALLLREGSSLVLNELKLDKLDYYLSLPDTLCVNDLYKSNR